MTFRVSWRTTQGADARRLLAIACRRGKIRGTDVGAIRVEPAYSLLDVAAPAAAAFEVEAARPDPRNPRMRIARYEQGGPPRPSPRASSRNPT